MSAPVPTEESTGALVKISASGPMPTSRYCDHAPCASNTSFTFAASAEPGHDAREVVAEHTAERRARGLGARCIAARLLFDHALEQAFDKGHAAGLDRLQVARREQPGLRIRRCAVALLLAMASSSEAMRGAWPPCSARRTASDGDSLRFEQVAHRGRELGKVVQPALMDCHQHRPDAGLPEAADQRGTRGVLREARGGVEVHWHGSCLSWVCVSRWVIVAPCFDARMRRQAPGCVRDAVEATTAIARSRFATRHENSG